ncbi:MAG: hypothetical protein IPJ79_12395 [Bacteroidetes bacterium]|nr:hypothetical protein [Bacteroidota bacterium]
MSDKMRELVNTLSEKYDHVIMDSPPIGLVTDGMLLTEYAAATVYVVRQNVTRKHHLEYVNSLYEQEKLKTLA